MMRKSKSKKCHIQKEKNCLQKTNETAKKNKIRKKKNQNFNQNTHILQFHEVIHPCLNGKYYAPQSLTCNVDRSYKYTKHNQTAFSSSEISYFLIVCLPTLKLYLGTIYSLCFFLAVPSFFFTSFIIINVAEAKIPYKTI